MKPKILIVEDNKSNRELLLKGLSAEGVYRLDTCAGSECVRQKIDRGEFTYDLILLDLILYKDPWNGIDILKFVKSEHPSISVIILTGYHSQELGAMAIEEGAMDFITKPYHFPYLKEKIKEALLFRNLTEENSVLRQTLRSPVGFSDLIGQSPPMKEVRRLIRQCASSRATVLITGASGTGKEVVANVIHQNSLYHRGPFIVMNCGAIPHSLIEAELFGYEKGAFTGATKRTKGKFEQAQNGTIFLDELGDLPLDAQVKLLRVLQEKEITRLGGGEKVKLNVRVIAATNRNLASDVREKTFREDLYYRIALFLIELPKLGERGDDIVSLAKHFSRRYGEIERGREIEIAPSAEKLIKNMSWPGNVRQLENCIYRTILMTPDKIILERDDIQFLPEALKTSNGTLEEAEKEAIQKSMAASQNNIPAAAVILGVSKSTLYRKIKDYDL